jgi:signal transduction histidine kinase
MISAPLTWLRSKARARVQRRTVRLRLTLVYGALFVVSGAALLAVTYVLFERATRTGSKSVEIPDTHAFGHTIPTLAPSAPTPKVVSIGPKALGEEIKRSSDLHQLLINSAIALAIVAVVALVLGWFVAGRMLRPLRTMTATARRISASNLHERLDLRGPSDELKQLGDTFDELLARLQRSWASQRQFVANVSHELRSPLTRLRLQADITATDPEATVESLQAGYQAVIAATQQQEELIAALLSLAKGQRGLDRQEIVDLASIATDALHAQRQAAERRREHITTDISPAVTEGDPRLIEQLVHNLLENAVLHNTVDGEIHVATAAHADKAVLSVSNDGPTIPPTELERLFLPFERLEPGRRHHKTGHGLGLSIVVATSHDAVITARCRAQGGLSIEIAFPSATVIPASPSTTAVGDRRHPARFQASDPTAAGSVQHAPGLPNAAAEP